MRFDKGLKTIYYLFKVKGERDIRLLRPVGRERWELSHENITVLNRLGAGAFGDVMAGTLKTSNGERRVALKRVR